MDGLFTQIFLETSVLYIISASLIDALLGSHRLLGRLPGPDQVYRWLIEAFILLLRINLKGMFAAFLLGLIVLWVLLGTSFYIGLWIDRLPNTDYSFIAKALLLALILGQRTVFDTGFYLFRRLKNSVTIEERDQFAAARWTIERIINRLADGFVANCLFFLLGGFAGLLAFRVLSVFAAVGSPKGVGLPPSPFFAVPGLLYALITLLPAGLYVLLIMVAALLIRPFRFFFALVAFFKGPFSPSIPLRLWALSANAWVLGINLKRDPDAKKSPLIWLGPKAGIARVTHKEVLQCLLLQIVAWLVILGLLGVTMLWFSA